MFKLEIKSLNINEFALLDVLCILKFFKFNPIVFC